MTSMEVAGFEHLESEVSVCKRSGSEQTGIQTMRLASGFIGSLMSVGNVLNRSVYFFQ